MKVLLRRLFTLLPLVLLFIAGSSWVSGMLSFEQFTVMSFCSIAAMYIVLLIEKAKLDTKQSFRVDPFKVESYKLMKSVLTSDGPEYEIIESFGLEGR